MLPAEVTFRPFRIDDADALISWASSADELLQWSGPNFSFPLDRQQVADYAATAGEHRRIVSGEVPDANEVVAHAELSILPEHELGQIRRVAVAPQMRGHGVGLALITWLLELAFDHLGLHRLELVVFSFNEPARRCYERAGFREEGRARHARKASDGYWDLIYMALLEDWHRNSR
jgi:RimJ/RimL family protein N-acetyltransferase